jgi:hypothetical protein
VSCPSSTRPMRTYRPSGREMGDHVYPTLAGVVAIVSLMLREVRPRRWRAVASPSNARAEAAALAEVDAAAEAAVEAALEAAAADEAEPEADVEAAAEDPKAEDAAEDTAEGIA